MTHNRLISLKGTLAWKIRFPLIFLSVGLRRSIFKTVSICQEIVEQPFDSLTVLSEFERHQNSTGKVL